jgi:hypothetical protein
MSLGGGLAMVVSRDECEYECEWEQVGAAGCWYRFWYRCRCRGWYL